jgi:hypothetical protein
MTKVVLDSFQPRAGVASKHFPQVDPASPWLWAEAAWDAVIAQRRLAPAFDLGEMLGGFLTAH